MLYLEPLLDGFIDAVKAVYDVDIDQKSIQLSHTKKEFDGDYTIVLFPYIKSLKDNPVSIGEKLGLHMRDNIAIIESTNVIKGFLNIELTDAHWIDALAKVEQSTNFGHKQPNGKKVMVEFSSPNTNKPLHLGHIRNILLGWSCAQIQKANGFEVIKTQIINDRGIAICKSMLAWSKFGEGKTPESTDTKPDHFVGSYYVLFEKKFQEEYAIWQASPSGINTSDELMKDNQTSDQFFKAYKNTYFNEHSILGKEAKAMLLEWEADEPKVKELWKKMNSWVYEGFDSTYDKLGVSFDKLYYESDTYVLGKKTVELGLEKGIFYQKEDTSVWIDLTDVGMDHKIVLRSDGTSVYMTQDIGTAMSRYADYGVDSMVYTVADEQDYHFKVLFEILKRFEEPYADGLHHLSYGMVDLTTGKMKSREGTVVDADDLVMDVIKEARQATIERGELDVLGEKEREDVIRRIGLAALKFFIIKVNPKKRMTFDPKESLDMQGQTGPYVQNAFVRVKSIDRRVDGDDDVSYASHSGLQDEEKSLMKHILDYPGKIHEAGIGYDPSTIANYCYALAKDYHRFYHGVRILKADTPEAKSFRLHISRVVASILEDAMRLLGIEMPERM